MPSSDAAHLRELFDLNSLVDELLEQAVQDRMSLEHALGRVLPAVAERVGARAVFVRTYGEDLTMRVFTFPSNLDHPSVHAFFDENQEHPDLRVSEVQSEALVVAQGLDVAGEWFGSMGMLFEPSKLDEAPATFLAEQLDVVCEQLDNFLFGIRAARTKHRVLMALAHALQHRVLARGLADAVKVLADVVPIEKLMLVVLAEEAPNAPAHVQIYDQGVLTVDTMSQAAAQQDNSLVQQQAQAFLRENDRALVERFGLHGARQEVLIHGIKETSLVGKVLVTSRSGDFDTQDRELLSGFADFIRQRVVDFNKEYKNLARSFRQADVNRMLQSPDYAERYLQPRDAIVAMLYVDIAGFTRASEQILIDPKKIGRLIDVWGARAVDLVWEYGGVFDKMVGDCVIGLFGPPFFDEPPGVALINAIKAADAIRSMTRALPELEEFAMLRAEGLAVTGGVNLAPLFVGTFGPNENYTGFSSGMNNTARLQAQATREEILVMQSSIDSLPEQHPFGFGEQRSAKVKNVANPLVFRPLTSIK
ncbi:MAG: adenylate/guanylate cyclase domain-containing protein [Polyangiaceae bacterium]